MPQNARPVLSVIVRRFRHEFADDIETSICRIQRAVSDQPGFIGLQNSVTPKKNGCELVTIVTFDTQANLERWENTPDRKNFVRELDSLSHDDATNTQFGDLTALTHPAARVSKKETVVILIVWILILGSLLRYPIDLLLPGSLGPFWRNALLTSVIVVLISYILLPFTSIVVTRLKAQFSRRHRE